MKTHLDICEEDFVIFEAHFIRFNALVTLDMMRSTWQLVLNLKGKSQNTILLRVMY